jgi:hypothetical protein
MNDNPLIEKLSSDLLQARKDGDASKKEILQAALTRITNAEAITLAGAPAAASVGVGSTEAVRRHVSIDEARKLIQQEIDELSEALNAMQSQPDHPYAIDLKNKITTLSNYLR